VQRGAKFLTTRGLVTHDNQIGVADSHTGNKSGGPVLMTVVLFGGEGALHELDQFISLRNGDEGSDRVDRDAVAPADSRGSILVEEVIACSPLR
jgi:hypothetical protein